MPVNQKCITPARGRRDCASTSQPRGQYLVCLGKERQLCDGNRYMGFIHVSRRMDERGVDSSRAPDMVPRISVHSLP
jgi:hypothetical protein